MELDTRPTDYSQLKSALEDIYADTKSSDATIKVTAANIADKLEVKLIQKEIPKNQFKTSLNKWPDQIQSYIKERMFVYISTYNNPSDTELQFINKFLDKALQDTDDTDASTYPEDQWAKSIRALAYQLRRYYGVEDTDDPLPCWWR